MWILMTDVMTMQEDQMTKKREQIAPEDKWNVEALYASWDSWRKEFEAFAHPNKKPHFPDLLAYKGKLHESAQLLKECVEKFLIVDRQLSKLYTYAHLKHDEDIGEVEAKTAYAQISSVCVDFREEMAWFEPEILRLPEATFQTYLKSPFMKPYTLLLEKIARMKPHTLSADKEALMAMMGKALASSSKAYSALSNADMKFGFAVDGQGRKHELTHAKFMTYMRSKDRVLRESAFKTMHAHYAQFENTLCELINGEIQTHVCDMRARGYHSCLEAALYPHQIDISVYKNLIKTVRQHLPVLHRYLKLRKELLGYSDLHLYDMYVPLVADAEMNYDFDQAKRMVIQSVNVLGKEYKDLLQGGLTQQRWVDRYENLRKRSGAYSSGCYDSMPYILMNFNGTFNDLMTLAHEAGHSMHSLYSHTHQPYQYSSYSIFVAEVASTFNEELMFQHLVQSRELKAHEKAFLINQKLDDIRATFFRQAMFAEFELTLHEWAEKDVPLTPQLLKETYLKLNQDYFGPDVVVDEEIAIEWARIPHFYYNFYVYQYATGISAALALSQRVAQQGDVARNQYLGFLSSGSNGYPIDILAKAGVNMNEASAINAAIAHFDHLIDELARAIKNKR